MDFGETRLNSSGPDKGPVAGLQECNNEHSSSIKGGDFLD
jgi:hypothetical protein